MAERGGLLQLSTAAARGELRVGRSAPLEPRERERLVRRAKLLAWIDAGSETMWKYIAAIARDAQAQGFDEANFDYVVNIGHQTRAGSYR